MLLRINVGMKPTSVYSTRYTYNRVGYWNITQGNQLLQGERRVHFSNYITELLIFLLIGLRVCIGREMSE